MPSKKQRRRREKLKRHEWEFVQLDEEGNEIPVEPAQLKKADLNGKPKAAAARSRRPLRPVKPPSWNRAAKRGLLFVPFLFIFLSIGKSAPPVPTRIGFSALYAFVFIPMFYFIDRMAYRAYQRRLGQS
jgi:hypothetical protein